MKLAQLDGLIAFATVAQKSSFTAAAAALEVSPPAVSQAIKQLEAKLGTLLLRRTTRSVGLTEAGARFLARVAPALVELEEASADLQRDDGQASGLLRITAPHVLYPMLLRPLLPGFFEKHPAVQVEISLDDGFIDIVKQGFDAGVRLGESIQLDMVAVPLTLRERTCLVASPAYLAAHGAPATVADLRHHNCVRYRFGSGSIYKWELLQRGRKVEVRVDGSLTVSDSVSMAQAAIDGIGIACVFERQVAHDIEAGRLLPVLPACWPSMPGFHIYYANRRQLAPKLRVFIDHLKETIEPAAPARAVRKRRGAK